MRRVVMEQWNSKLDAHTCSRCADLHGKYFPRGHGPKPPLHRRCRCTRDYSHITYQLSPAEAIKLGLRLRKEI